MLTLSDSYVKVPELRLTIENPMLPQETKEALLVTAVGDNPTALTKSFIRLVLRNDRENVMQLMANSYITLYRRQKNIIRGKLTTAVPVSSETENKMRAMVESKAKGAVEFETDVDPDIIGGFILEYDTFRMDASVKSKLNAILTALKK